MIIKTTKKFTFDLAKTDLDEIGEQISEYMAESKIALFPENNGIGPYEFWGMRGFDKGHDYLIIDDQEEVDFEIINPAKPHHDFRNGREIIEKMISNLNKRDFDENGIEMTAKLVIKNQTTTKEKFTATIIWQDIYE